MQAAFSNAKVYENGSFVIRNAIFDGTCLSYVSGDAVSSFQGKVFENCMIIPGLADAHVHFREPGFSYKETIATGSKAAARGGVTSVCTMPNLDPVPDSVEHLKIQTDIIERDSVIRIYPYGAITVGEKGETLADLDGMSKSVCAFSDDGRGVQEEQMMHKALLQAASLGKVIAAHCEVNSLLRGGYIHDGEYARLHGHRGICSESEYAEIDRDIRLAEEAGCAFHVCHISTAESVELIRQAKKRGVNVTCETGPHYLILCEDDLQEEGRFKMNPPLRSRRDKAALIEGLLDGTIDMIATDHAPHSAEEKSRGLEKSAMGVVGIECSFALMYTYFVRTGILTAEKLIELMSVAPKARFHLDGGNDFAVFRTEVPHVIDPNEFLSMGRATPFAGDTVYADCLLTVCRGKAVWISPEL